MPPAALLSRLLAILTAFCACVASAHPIPDIPVQGTFETSGVATVYVEVDPRCFDPEPNTATYLTRAVFTHYGEKEQQDLRDKAAALIERSIEFYFDPAGKQAPAFSFSFTGKGRAPLRSDDDVVVVTAEWKLRLPQGTDGWRIKALPGEKLAVVFQNVINGTTHPRLNVLFPGETSFTLDLKSIMADAEPQRTLGSRGDMLSTLGSFFVQGFVHVFPEGFDHIFFVLGLFLFSRSWRPLLMQITTFTVAHTLTLGLAAVGMVKAPGRFVDPVLALSIVFVAVENIYHSRYTRWRLGVVLLFGVIHGLAFASALQDLHLPQASLAVGLIGFNLGVEGGQLAVVAIAFALTSWFHDPVQYRRWVVIPASSAIALFGIWWAAERLLR